MSRDIPSKNHFGKKEPSLADRRRERALRETLANCVEEDETALHNLAKAEKYFRKIIAEQNTLQTNEEQADDIVDVTGSAAEIERKLLDVSLKAGDFKRVREGIKIGRKDVEERLLEELARFAEGGSPNEFDEYLRSTAERAYRERIEAVCEIAIRGKRFDVVEEIYQRYFHKNDPAIMKHRPNIWLASKALTEESLTDPDQARQRWENTYRKVITEHGEWEGQGSMEAARNTLENFPIIIREEREELLAVLESSKTDSAILNLALYHLKQGNLDKMRDELKSVGRPSLFDVRKLLVTMDEKSVPKEEIIGYITRWSLNVPTQIANIAEELMDSSEESALVFAKRAAKSFDAVRQKARDQNENRRGADLETAVLIACEFALLEGNMSRFQALVEGGELEDHLKVMHKNAMEFDISSVFRVFGRLAARNNLLLLPDQEQRGGDMLQELASRFKEAWQKNEQDPFNFEIIDQYARIGFTEGLLERIDKMLTASRETIDKLDRAWLHANWKTFDAATQKRIKAHLAPEFNETP